MTRGILQPMVSSFELHLRAEKKSPRTIRTYTEAAQWLAAEHLIPSGIKLRPRSGSLLRTCFPLACRTGPR